MTETERDMKVMSHQLKKIVPKKNLTETDLDPRKLHEIDIKPNKVMYCRLYIRHKMPPLKLYFKKIMPK